MSSAWEVLGIEATDDRRTIQRAYARALKRLDPDREQAGFEQLRGAYETALASIAAAQGEGARKPPEPGRHLPQIPLETNEGTADEQDVLAALEKALRSRHSLRAIQAFQTAMARGLLPVPLDPVTVWRLSRLAVEDVDLPGENFRAVMERLGWVSATGLPADPGTDLARKVLGRLTAENWYDALVKAASGRGRRRLAPQVLLGWRRQSFHDVFTRARIAGLMDEYRVHRRWLFPRFDPERMEQLSRTYAGRRSGSFDPDWIGKQYAAFLGWLIEKIRPR